MKSMDDEKRPQQCKNGTESSSESLLPRSYSSSSAADSSSLILSCSCESTHVDPCCIMCTEYRYFTSTKEYLFEKEFTSKEQMSLFLLFSHEKNAKSLKTNEVSKKIVPKSKSELLKDYCPYSSDNCGCSSGCTDCDYGLYTYTVKNKSKLKNKIKKLYARSSSAFRSLKTSEKSQRNAKSFSTMNVLRKKKAKFPKIEKALESCYPESSGSYDRKSDYIKCDFEKKTPARNSRKLKTTRTMRTLKLFSSKKISKNMETKVSENTSLIQSNSCDCNLDCTDCGKNITTRRKKLKNRYRRARASTKISQLPAVIDESIKNEKDSEKTAKIFPKRPLSWSSWRGDYSESDPYLTDEDCYNNQRTGKSANHVVQKLNRRILSEF